MWRGAIKQIVNVSRPGEPPRPGDRIEIECVGGWICQVDPRTQKSTTLHKQFLYGRDIIDGTIGG